MAFARALAPNPHLLLLDEPFAAIDAKVRQELRSWLKEMIEKLGITSIFVTHDQDEAIEVADEIIITNKGHIEQKGTPLEIYQNPQTSSTTGTRSAPSSPRSPRPRSLPPCARSSARSTSPTSVLNQLRQILVRAADEADIHFDGGDTADAFDFLFLKHT